MNPHTQNKKLSKKPHNHPAEPGIGTRIKTVKEVKKRAAKEMLTAAPAIVRAVLGELDLSLPPGSRPAPENLVRQTDRMRQGIRPEHPRTLDFDVCIYIYSLHDLSRIFDYFSSINIIR